MLAEAMALATHLWILCHEEVEAKPIHDHADGHSAKKEETDAKVKRVSPLKIVTPEKLRSRL